MNSFPERSASVGSCDAKRMECDDCDVPYLNETELWSSCSSAASRALSDASHSWSVRCVMPAYDHTNVDVLLGAPKAKVRFQLHGTTNRNADTDLREWVMHTRRMMCLCHTCFMFLLQGELTENVSHREQMRDYGTHVRKLRKCERKLSKREKVEKIEQTCEIWATRKLEKKNWANPRKFIKLEKIEQLRDSSENCAMWKGWGKVCENWANVKNLSNKKNLKKFVNKQSKRDKDQYLIVQHTFRFAQLLYTFSPFARTFTQWASLVSDDIVLISQFY